MKDNLEYRVERERNAQLEAVAILIKRRIMGYLQRKKYLKIREDIIKIQKNYKVLCGLRKIPKCETHQRRMQGYCFCALNILIFSVLLVVVGSSLLKLPNILTRTGTT